MRRRARGIARGAPTFFMPVAFVVSHMTPSTVSLVCSLQEKMQARLEQLVLQRQRAAEAATEAARRAAAEDERLAFLIANRQRELGELAAPDAAAHFLPRDYSGLPSDILAKIAGLLLEQRYGGCAPPYPSLSRFLSKPAPGCRPPQCVSCRPHIGVPPCLS